MTARLPERLVREAKISAHSFAGDRIGAFGLMLEAYEARPNRANARRVAAAIGTTTPLEEVLSAMRQHFDNTHYLSSYPDVAEATRNGRAHYLLFGWREGRNPAAYFDQKIYMRVHKLDPRAFPLAHFANGGHPPSATAGGAGGLFWFVPKAPELAAFDALAPAIRTADTRAVVVMPAFKGYDETLAAINHVLAARNGAPYSLLVINDRSPDAALSDAMAALAARGLFDYIANSENLGFVRSSNIGIRAAEPLDVVLLNSDAYVAPGWFERLSAHALSDDTVATVTPLSNNATICSYPLTNWNNAASLELSPADLDALAARVNAGRSVEAPTAIGFCMYIRRAAIDRIGMLDSDAFRMGYGEENDFSMRAINVGLRNLVAADVFVFHKGSVSFTVAKTEHLERGFKALRSKHPNYFDLVRWHIDADPERGLRRRLDVARLARLRKGCVVFVTHKWSGGIDTFLVAERRRLKEAGVDSLLLRVHDRQYASFEPWPGEGPFVPNLLKIDIGAEGTFISEALRLLEPSLVLVNTFAGLEWSAHAAMLDLIRRSGLTYDYVAHDYSSISHFYTLLRPDNVYQGYPDRQTRRSWGGMTLSSFVVDACDPDERIARYRPFLEGARRVTAPSQTARAILSNEYPDLDIAVAPHPDHLPQTRPSIRATGRRDLVVAVIGAIGAHKGSDVVAALAAFAQERGLPIRYVLIGYSNRDTELKTAGVTITGEYSGEQEAFDRLDEIQPDLVLIPSVWPETFCYTLSIAMRKEIPVVVFDLGAQAERVRASGRGVVLPLDMIQAPGRMTEALTGLPLDDLWTEGSRTLEIPPLARPGA